MRLKPPGTMLPTSSLRRLFPRTRTISAPQVKADHGIAFIVLNTEGDDDGHGFDTPTKWLEVFSPTWTQTIVYVQKS
jgi:hypothetical protein